MRSFYLDLVGKFPLSVRRMTMIETTDEAREILERSIKNFCIDFNSGRITPILESDVAGYLYHRMVSNGCPITQLYLATRIKGDAARRRRPDLVVGNLDRDDATISPLLIAELKVFQRWGHTDQQMRHRFSSLISEDLLSLEELSTALPIGRVEIVFDLFASPQRRGYLTGTWDGRNRKEIIHEMCRERSIELLWLHPNLGNDDVIYERMEWQ